jgi:hypothetical protein
VPSSITLTPTVHSNTNLPAASGSTNPSQSTTVIAPSNLKSSISEGAIGGIVGGILGAAVLFLIGVVLFVLRRKNAPAELELQGMRPSFNVHDTGEEV